MGEDAGCRVGSVAKTKVTVADRGDFVEKRRLELRFRFFDLKRIRAFDIFSSIHSFITYNLRRACLFDGRRICSFAEAVD